MAHSDQVVQCSLSYKVVQSQVIIMRVPAMTVPNTVQKRIWVLTFGVSFDQQLDSVDFTVDLSFFHNAAGKLLLPLLLNWGRAQRQAQSQFPADPKLTSSKWLLSNLLRIQLESHIGCDIKTSLVVVHLPAALDSTPAPPLVLCVT